MNTRLFLIIDSVFVHDSFATIISQCKTTSSTAYMMKLGECMRGFSQGPCDTKFLAMTTESGKFWELKAVSLASQTHDMVM